MGKDFQATVTICITHASRNPHIRCLLCFYEVKTISLNNSKRTECPARQVTHYKRLLAIVEYVANII